MTTVTIDKHYFNLCTTDFRKATNLVGDEIHLQKPELNNKTDQFESSEDDHHVLEKYTFSNALALSGTKREGWGSGADSQGVKYLF